MNKYFEYRDGKLYWKVAAAHRIKVGQEAGNKNHNGYVRVGINGKLNSAHRIIWEMFHGKIPKGLHIDHINGVKDDNRIENLQLVTGKQNNQRKNYSTGYGYLKNRVRPYIAQKTFNSKHYFLGCYGTPCGAYMSNRMFFINNGGL